MIKEKHSGGGDLVGALTLQWDAEVLAQRFAAIIRAEQAAPLKNGNNVIDERRRAVGQNIGYDVEPVDCASPEPFFEGCGNLFRRSDQHSVPVSRRLYDDLADCFAGAHESFHSAMLANGKSSARMSRQ
ncbi:hypothetical protein [Bradyrhizobium japonicum]|uniref:hypothetical protein n=1 Tax=Bradyrhizobium japonicum TaxID=375 RepID=UPI0020A1D0A1|nr:hypothetical protein [Bradyrhizobium japonicum]MCP1748207.1 hypothetical protein [Bradyrhizobium japonicum]MCP1866129.1 hypothetical protein [Bradyrhizobium japonicum]